MRFGAELTADTCAHEPDILSSRANLSDRVSQPLSEQSFVANSEQIPLANLLGGKQTANQAHEFRWKNKDTCRSYCHYN